MSTNLMPCPTPTLCKVSYGHEPNSPAAAMCKLRQQAKPWVASQGQVRTTSSDTTLASEPIQIGGVYSSMSQQGSKTTYTFDNEENGQHIEVSLDSHGGQAKSGPEVMERMLANAVSLSTTMESHQHRDLMLQLHGSPRKVRQAYADLAADKAARRAAQEAEFGPEKVFADMTAEREELGDSYFSFDEYVGMGIRSITTAWEKEKAQYGFTVDLSMEEESAEEKRFRQLMQKRDKNDYADFSDDAYTQAALAAVAAQVIRERRVMDEVRAQREAAGNRERPRRSLMDRLRGR